MRRMEGRTGLKLAATAGVIAVCTVLAGAATWSNLNATATSAPNTFTAAADWVAPAGGSVDATGLGGNGTRYSTSKTLHVALAKGTDSGSGLAATGAQLLRASAALASSDGIADGTCGTDSAFAQVASLDPTSPVSDIVPTDNRCYRYEYLVSDNANNVATYISPEIKVQTAPAALTTSSVLITPVTGSSAQVVSGASVAYQSGQSGSFTVQASLSDVQSGVTAVAFPVVSGFSGGGVVTTPISGTTFRTTYSWSANGTSPSPGSQTITATDGAGLSQANVAAFSLVKAVTATAHALSLTGVTGAYLSARNLYYNSNASGSFKLVDAFTAPAGPASVTYPALGQSGWTHASSETISTPSGGPYTSSVFSWNAHPNSPAGYTVSGLDNSSNSSTTSVTFISDQSPPSGGSLSYPTGLINVPSVPITTTTGTDAQSGVNPLSGVITRDEIPLTTSTDACVGSFPNTFATTVTLIGGADTTATNGHCYQYRYQISDNVGNQATYTGSQTPVEIDTTPKVTAITSLQSNGTAGDGQLQLGDQLILTFNENLAFATVPATFASASEARLGNGVVTVTIPGITNGAISTGSGSYLSGQGTKTATFAGSVALVNNGASTTVTITVTSLSGAATAASSGTLPFVTAPSITGTDATGASGTFTPNGGFRLF